MIGTCVQKTLNSVSRAFVPGALVVVMAVLPGCSSTTLPWPDLSVSRDEANDGLTKQEQSLLEEMLSSKQKNHRKDAVKEIEDR